MKKTVLILMLAACTVAATAQTPAPPAAPAAKPAVAATAAKPATAATSSTAKPAAPATKAAPATLPTVAAIIKEPAAIATKGIQKPFFTVALRYKDIKVGDGTPAEPGKQLKCLFTLWTKDGVEIDSTDDHRAPQLDKDHQPVVDANGKPVLGDPQPMPVVMGQGRPLPGWDMGFEGMKAGGKRRVYIPWQLGLGAREMPARDPKHSAVPAKTDLILEIELKEVTDAPPPPQRPGMMPGMRPGAGGQPMSMKPGTPGAPGAPVQMPVAPKPAAPPAPGTAPSAAAPATPAAPPAPGAAPSAAAPPAPAPPATAPAVPPTPAQPQPK